MSDKTVGLYHYFFDFGRCGKLEGLFEATREEAGNLVGASIYLGEVLGKHSEIEVYVQDEEVRLVTEDMDFIRRLREFGITFIGLDINERYRDQYSCEDEEDDADGET